MITLRIKNVTIHTGVSWSRLILIMETENRPTLPQYSNEGVVLYWLRSCDAKRQ